MSPDPLVSDRGPLADPDPSPSPVVAPKARPKRAPLRPAGPLSLADSIRSVIASRRLSAHSVARAAGVDPVGLRKFLRRLKSIDVETAGRLCLALGLSVVEGRGGLR